MKNCSDHLEIEKNERLPGFTPEASFEFLQSLVNGSNDAIISKSLDGKITGWNPAAERMFGYKSSEILGQSVLKLFPDNLIGEEGKIISRIMLGEQLQHYETIRKRRDGSVFPASVTVSPIVDKNNQIIGASKIVRDVSLRRALEDQMRLSAKVFEYANEAIIVADNDGKFIHVNKAFTEITGYGLEDVIGKTPTLFKSSRQGPDVSVQMLADLKSQGHCQGEVWSRRKTGEAFAALVSVSRVDEQDGSPGRYIAMFADITTIREQQELLERMAHYDLLTNLPNRILLAERLEQSIKKCDRHKAELAVAYLDLDGFKEINDKLGHSIGDEVLAAIGRRMSATIRETDTLARIGGDEFVLLIEFEHGSEEYLTALHRILTVCKQAVIVDGVEVVLSVSGGVTVYPNDDASPDLLLRHADQAMYEAKQAGRDQIKCFDTKRDQRVQKTYSLINGLSKAIENDELFLEFQPKVDVTNGDIIGAEALIRWAHPERGTLYPNEFIRPIEDLPIIDTVGYWVIEKTLNLLERLQAVGYEFPISVNIAPRHFLEKDFPETLRDILNSRKKFIIEKRLLEIEIIETQKFFDLSSVSNIMHSCSEMGARFSLDDFGTGYSSLLYLKELPAETLKIDRSFITGMNESQNALLIVKAILGLASAFNREVIAEGVETYDQANLLVNLGCRVIQGYGIAKPMPEDKFEQWCKEWNNRQQSLLLDKGLAFPGITLP